VRTPSEHRAAMRWAQRLKRVFGIDVETCAGCGGAMRIIACIEDPAVIKAILAQLAGKARPVHGPRLPPRRLKGSDPFTLLYGPFTGSATFINQTSQSTHSAAELVSNSPLEASGESRIPRPTRFSSRLESAINYALLDRSSHAGIGPQFDKLPSEHLQN
jgi:hypothetical protein